MSIADLKTRLHDVPGIETLMMQIIGGRQDYSIDGKLISLDAGASDADLEKAIHAGVASTAIAGATA